MNNKEKLIEYQNAYYEGKPLVSDLEYDTFYDKVKSMYPNADCINRVGGNLINTFEEVEHTIPMLSMDKRYSEKEIKEFIRKMDCKIIAEPKIDGISIVLYYKGGKLDKALTRGNGHVGNDVTNNVRTIKDIPKVLTRAIDIVVRGEIYLPKKELDIINAKSEVKYANCRNLTAGLMRHKHASKLKDINLSIFVYEGYYRDSPYQHDEILQDLDNLGFKVNNFTCTDATMLDMTIEQFTQCRNTLDYDIDGIVFKVNDINKRNELGYTAHHPKWAMAYKFESPQATSKLLDIEIQVGRTGRITPVAKIVPTLLQGSTISSVTLHNQDYINMLDLAIGDTVTLSKRGDVIPAIEEVTDKGDNLLYVMPNICPACGSTLYKEGAHLFCENFSCKERVINSLSFIVAKNQLDIDGLGETTIRTLYDLGSYKHFLDILYYDYHKLESIEGFGKVKVQNIYDGIAKLQGIKLSRMLASLGLDGLGHKASKLLVNHYDNIKELLECNVDELTSIDGIGLVTANSIIDSINANYLGIMIVNDELNCIYDKEVINDKALTYCITGTFDIKRSDIVKLIEAQDNKVVSSVTRNLDYLVCGKKAGSKKAKAEKLGIKIIYLEDIK